MDLGQALNYCEELQAIASREPCLSPEALVRIQTIALFFEGQKAISLDLRLHLGTVVAGLSQWVSTPAWPLEGPQPAQRQGEILDALGQLRQSVINAMALYRI